MSMSGTPAFWLARYGLVLSEGPSIGPESKPEGRTIQTFMNSPGYVFVSIRSTCSMCRATCATVRSASSNSEIVPKGSVIE